MSIDELRCVVHEDVHCSESLGGFLHALLDAFLVADVGVLEHDVFIFALFSKLFRHLEAFLLVDVGYYDGASFFGKSSCTCFTDSRCATCNHSNLVYKGVCKEGGCCFSDEAEGWFVCDELTEHL